MNAPDTADAKNKKIRSLLGYLQENVPNVHTIDADAPEEQTKEEEDAGLGAVPSPTRKPKPARY